MLLFHHNVGGVLQRAGKVHPGKEGAVVKNGIRQAVESIFASLPKKRLKTTMVMKG